jgi:glycosyltransferase involved in cell wall biosynthesis
MVFLVQRFPGYGGAEEYVRRLVWKLSESGIDCMVLTSNLDKRNTSDLPELVRVLKLPVILKIGEYALWRGLPGVLLRSHADILHVNTYGYFHTDATCLARKLKKFKVVLTGHGFHGLEISLRRGRWDLSQVSFWAKCRYASRPLYDWTLGRNEIASADALVALSRRDVEIYKWMGARESKIHEIPQGVRDTFFEDVNKEVVTILQERLNGDPVILSVGELSWVKGKDILLRAFALLAKENPRARLVYVGKDAGMYRVLKELASHLGVEKSVLFPGYVPPDQLVHYYNAADVLVHTSYAEGLSTIILEAMAAGLPVISTPAGGNAYILHESRSGIVVPFDDASSTYLAVRRVLADDNLRRSLGTNGRTYAYDNFRWNTVVKRHMALYQDLLSESS